MDIFRADIWITSKRGRAALQTSEGVHTFKLCDATRQKIIAILVMEDPHCPSTGIDTPQAGTPSLAL